MQAKSLCTISKVLPANSVTTGFVLATDFSYMTKFFVNTIMRNGWCLLTWCTIPAASRTYEAGDHLNMNYENQHSLLPPPLAPPPLPPRLPPHTVQPTLAPPLQQSVAVVAASSASAAIAPPTPSHQPLCSDKPTLAPPSTNQPVRDDGSSGYGSPDSETFDAPCN